MTTETTTAQQVARMFGDDGSEFFLRGPNRERLEDTDGERYGIGDVCAMFGCHSHRIGHDTVREQFSDGSAIVIAVGGWDLAIEGSSEDCSCWADADHGQHTEDCPDNG